MATINYTIETDGGNPLIEGFGWTGTLVVQDLLSAPVSSFPTSVTGTVGGLTITFTPHSTNGYYVYPSTTDANHYITFRSQNISTQYPSDGYSLDIWPLDGVNSLYNDIIAGKSWQGLIDDGPYTLSNVKYTLLYDYTPGNPTAQMWCRGGKITFTEAV